MKIKAALFDLDGVIIDTETQYSRFWGEQCRRYFPDQPGLENVIKGQTLTQIYDRVFADLPDEQPLITQRLDEYELQMTYDYIPGARAFIENLRQQGIKTAVVTSSNQPKMRNVHRAHPELTELFDAILTAEDFTESKPHPQCYLRAAERLGCLPEECVGFEDSFNGLRAVRSAGMTVVGLATTNPADAIMPLADIVVSDFRHLRLDDIARAVHNK
ncbi:MAG: HAD family phosphatase [Prevotella sp.]|nr:HAD family phosphatase [Prevotella sp.]MBR5036992.1 HAD family phosphatase [Prevotella sp.]